MKKVDAIILGQGLAGTCMAISLIKMNRSVCVFDPRNHQREGVKNASRSAAGLFNPITGRKMVKTWLADELFADLSRFYTDLETEWGKSFFHQVPIYRPFHSVEDQNDWVGMDRDPAFDHLIARVFTKASGIKNIDDPFGGLLLKNCGYLDIPVFLDAAYEWLLSSGSIFEGIVKEDHLTYKEDGVIYTDGSNKIESRWVIDCTGVQANDSKIWSVLKFRPVKGEWLTMNLDYETNHIVNRGVFMIPRENAVRVGATYDHSNLDHSPTLKAREEFLQKMGKIYTGEYRILDQQAGIRPATFDRKPFVGVHPLKKSLAMLNGLGAKGVTLAPYFSRHLAEHLINDRPIMKEVDVLRCF